VDTANVTDVDAPGASRAVDVDRWPKETNRWVLVVRWILPVTPKAGLPPLGPKTTAVHLPARGFVTWTLSSWLKPCGMEFAANFPVGLIRIRYGMLSVFRVTG